MIVNDIFNNKMDILIVKIFCHYKDIHAYSVIIIMQIDILS